LLKQITINLDLELEKIKKVRKYRDFDKEYTVKMFGFESPDDYYFKSSSFRDIKNIRVPTLFLNSQNDCFSPIDSISLNNCKKYLVY